MVDGLSHVDLLQLDGGVSFEGTQHGRIDLAPGGSQIDEVQQVALQSRFGLLDLVSGKQAVDRPDVGPSHFPDQPRHRGDEQREEQRPPQTNPEATRHDPLIEYDERQQIAEEHRRDTGQRDEQISRLDRGPRLLKFQIDVLVKIDITRRVRGTGGS